MSAPPPAHRPTPVIAIVGWKKSGKTTLVVRLIEEFTRRGHLVGSIKHAHESFQVDEAPTDSARHRTAGSAEVCIVGAQRWAIIHTLVHEPEPSLETVLSWMSPADLIIVEGYKAAAISKIEVRSATARSRAPLAPGDPHVIAIACDEPQRDERLPVLARDDVPGLADLITAAIGPLGKRHAGS